MVNDQKDIEKDPTMVLDALREKGNTSYKQGAWFLLASTSPRTWGVGEHGLPQGAQ
jgi:hypothetical protein